ncbi:MAG: PKD domain-containing protein, partial [Chthoniobacterales bacterium]
MKKTSLQSAFVNPRVLFAFTLCFIGTVIALLGLGVFTGSSAQAQGENAKENLAKSEQRTGMISVASERNDVSPPLRNQPPWPVKAKEFEREANLNPRLPHKHVDSPDPVVQNAHASMLAKLAPSIPNPIRNFDGIPFPGVGCNCAPPDTNGEVGATQYVQMVNEALQVFDKSNGNSLLGPVGIQSVWAGFGGVCETGGSGDPIVLYDQLANRWVITQFAGSPPTHECIAVSQTSDATGAYFRYDFTLGTNFFDYPHLAVWIDGYYMADNVFNAGGTAFLGTQAFVFDRAKMLAGLPATFISPGLTPGGANNEYFLPADIDGNNLPTAGARAPFVETPGTGNGNTYKTWHFHADFVTPANSTFTVFASPPAAGYTALCPSTRACVPELGAAAALDGIGDRLMYRLAYRKFADGHDAVVGNLSVSSGGVAGVRWFELRNVNAGPLTVFQESTYQPDTTWRWMGSAAMDKDGNMALGFSASSATINPQLRYAGRLVSDPLNTLAQGEATLFAGTGSQTGTGNRWGDYSGLTIDPVDDSTFWYTNEYYATTGTFNWRTR